MIAALVEGSLFVFFNIAEPTAVRAVVPPTQLPTALAQNQARNQGAALAGRPVAGLLFSVARFAPFLADALPYLASIATLLLIRTEFQHERTHTCPAGDVGVVISRRHRDDLADPEPARQREQLRRGALSGGLQVFLVIQASDLVIVIVIAGEAAHGVPEAGTGVLADLRDGAATAGQASLGQDTVIAHLYHVEDLQARFRHACSISAPDRSTRTPPGRMGNSLPGPCTIICSCRHKHLLRSAPRSGFEQRAVEPDIFVTRGNKEPGAWRQGQVLSYLGAALQQVPGMPGLEEVVIVGHLARPDVPAGCLLYWLMAQPVDRPVPAPVDERPADPDYGILFQLIHGHEYGGSMFAGDAGCRSRGTCECWQLGARVSARTLPLLPARAVVNAQDYHLDERLKHRGLVLVILPPVTFVVTGHNRGSNAPASLSRGELRLIHAPAGPAAVQVKPLVLDEGVPLVIHVPGHVASLDHGPLLARPYTIWRRNVLRLRNRQQLAE
jgi:hypothetical protein